MERSSFLLTVTAVITTLFFSIRKEPQCVGGQGGSSAVLQADLIVRASGALRAAHSG